MGNLDRRLRWLERGNGGEPRLVRSGPHMVTIHGGLPQPLTAMVPGIGLGLAALPSEPLDGFQNRAWKWAGDLDAEFVVISGQVI
jgi:hypothetical protein